MPQLEISTYLTQIFWVLITFISFWIIMDRVIIPRIAEQIEARKRKYDDFILKAEEINKKAIASLKQYEKALAAAKAQAVEQINLNEAELKQFVAEKEASLNETLKEKIAENEAMLEKEKNETLKKIESLSQNAAFAILEKLEIKSISLEDVKNASKNIEE